MKRVLVLASTASMIEQFNIPNIQLLQSMGFAVDAACNFERGSTCNRETIEKLKENLKSMNVGYYHIDFSRDVKNFREHKKAYKQTLKLIRENNYEFIHCHTPIGGVIGRLCGHRTKTKVIYTAHGFHFFKGGSKLSWLLFYPVEKYLLKYTDALITINNGDYNLAKTKMKAKNVYYIPGVGIDFDRFINCRINKSEKRKELNIPDDAIMLLSIGELCKRKNHETIIKAMANIENKNVYYCVAGIGGLEDYLMNLASELGLKDRVRLLGYVNNTPELYKCCDIFCFPSTREGLGLAGVEAMASGVPVVASDAQGIPDYVVDGITGFKCSPTDVDAFADKISILIENKELRDEIGKNNINAARRFDVKNVMNITRRIYGSMRRRREEERSVSEKLLKISEKAMDQMTDKRVSFSLLGGNGYDAFTDNK